MPEERPADDMEFPLPAMTITLLWKTTIGAAPWIKSLNPMVLIVHSQLPFSSSAVHCALERNARECKASHDASGAPGVKKANRPAPTALIKRKRRFP